MSDPLNRESLSDDLFRNRIAAALRELDQPESDADIAAALDAVDAEPLSDEARQRILQRVRHSIATTTAVAAGGSNGEPDASHRISLRRVDIVPPPSRGLSQIGIVAACAVALLAIGLVFFRSHPGDRTPVAAKNRLTPELRPGELISSNDRTPLAPAHSGGNHPDSGTGRAEPSSTVAAIQRVKPGETLTTGLREKRRVTLPDGSVLSINEQSRVTIVSERRVKLLAGEVFVEVVPCESSERFVVETPHRTVTALGTKFVVKAQDRATNVVVTQGKVRVSGVDEAVSAGQELIADLTESNSAELRPAKRSAYVVEWVKDLMAAAGSIVVPASEHAGGTVTVVDPQGQEMKLSLRKFHVDVHIEEGFARTTIDQTYFNHTWQQLEGTFRFPLPADASLSRLAMYVNGKLMEGGMVERDYGRNVFEQIRHTRRDPALLEWVDGSTFQMRVFPLEARQEKRILLSYTQRLPNDYGKSAYRFPAGHSLEGVREWSAHLRVKGAAGSKWYSPSHLLNGRDEHGDLLLDGRDEYAALDRDLIVELVADAASIRTDAGSVGHGGSWSLCEQDGFQYVMLRQRPDLKANAERSPRQWIFLIENSADRNEVLAETQRQIAKVLLENAEHSDTFSLIRAGTQAESFRRKPVDCSLENVAAAQQFLRDVAPIGALDLEQALQAVQKQVRGQRDVWIVHLGTGIPVLAERDDNTLLRLLPTNARYVGVAVGKRWSKSFMESAASHSGGHVTQINPDEAVAWRAFDLLSTLNAPRLTEIAVRSTPTRSVSEGERVKDAASESEFLLLTNSLAHGQELAAVARFPKGQPLPQSVTITGKLNGKAYSSNSTLRVEPLNSGSQAVGQCGHLPRTWARLEIDRLVALGATEHKPQIIELSKSMYVMSPFTSLLVLETEAMYEQFKVDRGRKDHWAMYPAPAEITVVADQGASQLSPLDAAKERLKLSQARAKSAQSNYERSVTEKRPATDLKRLDRLNRAEQAEVRLIEREIQRIERATEAAADPVRLAWESVVLRRSNWQQGYFQTASNYWRFSQWGDSDLGVPVDRLGTQLKGVNHGLSPIRLGFTPSFSLDTSVVTWEANAHGNLSGLDPFSVTLNVTPRIIIQEEEELLGLDPFYRNSNGSDSRLDGELWRKPRNEFMPATSYFATFGGDLDEARYGRVRLLDSTSDYVLGANVSGLESKFLSDLTEWEYLESDKETLRAVVSHRRRINLNMVSRTERLTSLVDGRLADGRRQWFENQNFDDSAFITGGLSDDGLRESTLRLYSGLSTRTKFGEVRTGSGRRVLRGDTSVRYALPQLSDFGMVDEDIKFVVEGLNIDLDLPGLLPRIVSGTTRFDPQVEYEIDSNGNGVLDLVEDRMADGWSYPVIGGGSMPAGSFWGQDGRLYQRRATHPLAGVMKDLPSYAPGLQTWPADRLAIVAQAAAMKPKSGEVDAEARRLIEKARSLGWEKVRFVRQRDMKAVEPNVRSDRPGDFVLADGSGRFVVDREVGEGLKEQVTHDGSTLWHLYPEIALGAKRTMSRFHQSAIQSLIPWYVPAVDDLSVEADVKSVGERTIRITRMKREEPAALVAAASEKVKPAPAPHQIAVELVFAEDGRLSVLRVIDITANKVLAKQTFSADGTVRLLDADDKLIGEVQYERQPVEAPNLVPVVKDLVVLPLPYRSAAGVPVSVPVNLQTNAPDFAKLSDDDALKLLATYFAEARQSELVTFIEQRYTARGDHRIGLAVLLSSVMPQNPLVANATKQHPDMPLARFLEQFGGFPSQGSLEGTLDAGEAASPFLKRVCSAYNHYSRWATDRAAARERSAADIQTELAATLRFIRECHSVDLVAKLLSTVQLGLKRTERMNATFARQLIDATAALADERGIPAFGRTARIEWLLAVGDDASVTHARELLRTHLTDAIANGVLPELNGETRSAFVKHFKTPDGQPCGPWGELVKEAALELAEKKRPHTLIALARACFSLSEPALAAEVFQLAIKDQDLAAQPRLNLAALACAKEAGNWEQAEVCVRHALANEKLQQVPQLWRDAASIAHHLRKFHDWIDSLDRAYELEFAALPKTVNLETFRQDYDSLFGQLDQRTEQLADAKQSEKLAFARMVQRAASRWRDIDTDDTAACHRTARILTKLGLATAAWNYWTTPLAEAPDRSTVWLTFAAAMNSEQQFLVADRAWSTAFACESTNPEILLQHAQFLRTAGQEHRAHELLTRITTNTWQPRFENIKSQAQTLLTGGTPPK
ncbi:MAG: VIT domain-containing protein [Planctomycetota bacterium]